MPYRIHTVLTDNGIQFRFALRHGDGPTARYMTHMFDMRCQKDGIEHRFTRINHPWTNSPCSLGCPRYEVGSVGRETDDAAIEVHAGADH